MVGLLLLGMQTVQAQQNVVDAGSPLKVVATFSVLADMVKQLGGDFVEVSALVDWDEDTHVFQPSPGDVKKVTAADLLVLNGLGFEGWLARLLNAAGFSGISVEATKGVDLIKMDLRGSQGFAPYRRQSASVYDPHAWQSLKAARHYVMNISAALMRIDPLHAADYLVLRDTYLQQIVQLDESITHSLSRIPEHKRRLVVPHNAFAYLARDYHLTIHSLQGMSTDSEASAADMIQLVRLIKALNITAIFTETISDQRLIRVIEAETDAHIEGALISGALSRTLAPRYLDMIGYNTDLIIRALSR
jgi:zinc/manganese transport system substrate-binding protein